VKCSRRSTRSGNYARGRQRAGIAGNREYNNGWHTAIDLGNMVVVSEAITRAALLRKESRGAQFREDFPGQRLGMGKVQHRHQARRRR
jgi:succinate dehydrogenase / fumarate reductase flavoprotein subunit